MRKATMMLPAGLLFAGLAWAQSDSAAAVQQTEQMNQSQASQAAQDNAQYQQQQQYQAAKQSYDSQSARYLAARDRYAAERTRYQRGEWPKRYEKLAFVDTDALVGAPVETYSGTAVGHVVDLAKVGGRIDAVRVALDDGASHVWVDRSDLKFDTEDRLLATDFARHDLYSMAAEQH